MCVMVNPIGKCNEQQVWACRPIQEVKLVDIVRVVGVAQDNDCKLELTNHLFDA